MGFNTNILKVSLNLEDSALIHTFRSIKKSTATFGLNTRKNAF